MPLSHRKRRQARRIHLESGTPRHRAWPAWRRAIVLPFVSPSSRRPHERNEMGATRWTSLGLPRVSRFGPTPRRRRASQSGLSGSCRIMPSRSRTPRAAGTQETTSFRSAVRERWSGHGVSLGDGVLIVMDVAIGARGVMESLRRCGWHHGGTVRRVPVSFRSPSARRTSAAVGQRQKRFNCPAVIISCCLFFSPRRRRGRCTRRAAWPPHSHTISGRYLSLFCHCGEGRAMAGHYSASEAGTLSP